MSKKTLQASITAASILISPIFASDATLEPKTADWSALVSEFTEAFTAGDVEKLEHLKDRSCSFANIDDLGSRFSVYGAGMDGWERLIGDARKNAPSAATSEPKELEWGTLVSQFTEAFNAGDVETLEKLKEEQHQYGFANLDDLGSVFSKYGVGMDKWDELIADARKNASK